MIPITTRPSIKVVLRIVLVLAILSIFGIQTTSFAALIAAAGIAIGAAWSGLLANFAAGAADYPWARFTIWGIAGEAVWVGLYIGLGYGFAGNIQAASDMAGSVLGILAGVAAMLAFGYWLLTALRSEKAEA